MVIMCKASLRSFVSFWVSAQRKDKENHVMLLLALTMYAISCVAEFTLEQLRGHEKPSCVEYQRLQFHYVGRLLSRCY